MTSANHEDAEPAASSPQRQAPRQAGSRLWILPVFFLSGSSGLIYQVLWVREFGQVFGNTVYSASLVTAAFMCGLGVGSWVAGAWCDRRRASRALAAYGVAELLIAALGLGAALLVPRLAAVSVAVSSYVTGADGWQRLSVASHAVRYLSAVLLLGAPTALMGATLTLLVRWFVGGAVALAGRRVSVLYGVNTAGAALGCLLTDAWLVPHLGLFRTQLVAVAGNVVAGLGALALLRGEGRGGGALTAPPPVEMPIAVRPPRPPWDLAPGQWLALAMGLSGFAGMALEIVWFRSVSAAFGHSRGLFSLLLTVLLVGMWLGSVAAGRASARGALPRYATAQCLLTASALVLLSVLDPDIPDPLYAALGVTALHTNAFAQGAALFGAIAFLVGLPSLLMGVTFPLANAALQDEEARIGRRAGGLYLANTAGALLGSLVTGFGLIPAVGIQNSAWVAAATASLAAAAAWQASRARGEDGGRAPVVLVSAAAALIALAAFRALPGDYLVRSTLPLAPADKLLGLTEAVDQTVAVARDASGSLRLYTDGHSMSSTTPESQRYMRAFAHVPLLQLDSPRAALLICFGVGNTAHALSLHPTLERIDVADLSDAVLSHAHDFGGTNGDVLDDPRVRVVVNDGRQHLRMASPETYDLVTLEPPPIGDAGVASLYSREFYELARGRLKPGGFITQWLPIYQVPPGVALSLVRSFIEVFPASALLSGNLKELVLIGRKAPSLELDLDGVSRRLAERPAVAADLRRIGLAEPAELAGMFLSDGRDLATAVEGNAPTTDDRPLLEYAYLAWLAETPFPPALVRLDGLPRYCPACFAGGRPRDDRGELDGYLRVLRALYQHPLFLSPDGSRLSGERIPLLAHDATAGAMVSRHAYLERSFGSFLTGSLAPPAGYTGDIGPLRARVAATPGDPGLHVELAAAVLSGRDRAAALPELDAALALDPALAPAHFARGFVLFQLGREGAIAEYQKGLAAAPDNLRARMTLAVLLADGGRRVEAVRELQTVVLRAPENAEAQGALCALLARDPERTPYCDSARRLATLPQGPGRPPR